jgi:[acyl-carrier-protein] S-malonyltransferase
MNYKEFKLKRVKRIAVSGAFHTSLMDSKDRMDLFKQQLDETVFSKPLIDTYSNRTAQPYINSWQIRRLLVEQISNSVKWEQIMHRIYEKCEEFPETYECGPGKQLGTILKMVNAKAHVSYKNIEV